MASLSCSTGAGGGGGDKFVSLWGTCEGDGGGGLEDPLEGGGLEEPLGMVPLPAGGGGGTAWFTGLDFPACGGGDDGSVSFFG